MAPGTGAGTSGGTPVTGILQYQRRVFASNLRAPARLVALAVLDHWSPTRPMWPSVPRLATLTGLSERSVKTALAELEGAHALSVSRGRGRRNEYTLGPMLTQDGPCSSAADAPVSSAGGAPDTRARAAPVQEVPLSSAGGAPQVVQEVPPKEPSEQTQEVTQSPRKPRRKPQRPIPADWEPLPRQRERAQERGIDCALAAERFRAHAESVDRRCADWARAFDNWLLGERVPARRTAAEPQRGVRPGWEPRRFGE